MKYFELDEEEKEILKAFNNGELKSVPNVKKEIARYTAYAKAALNKTKNVNLRISEADLLKIKAKALEKGIPYQTLMASLIHQYSTGRIKEQN
ncbi:MAG: hypothetical protein A3I07_01050 [Candidatus Doudnabacteria bacterium RIFCSPLOWO2_02_FULL_42_9]|uniref:Antitoxin n=1 Tax=Candidatus Doudnabacteria bacterium RIFCSPHIGHO2_01_FULL_41_86 TaxID=1817821 RepID=A0A1F5N7H5_9BACT|nr:MAG: hypothetical protein A2717_00060 [Candidatus Doudnabacteria bacterium RIFCSPHIGHO2_01_FULL_41_86]OGE74960.1 MAG: hypothetical protein A3K07_03550 [Candidatus Doudnabacteria bacterium RIFCSPHIGHO2_01_43_10]OGE85615.1 MAG: hypothetical protein A3E28_04625 [Candidatus Doudnabacteria bacterium RIFCSPHIGHO2_12_FULL_42_22]OGE86552.1 MAG: hypothetical protein A3C49_00060 [Candidatus Doudnabacteria bacterium RIFCSPHIGHO2_02_FULL_42_25]OGE91969.1 MAG: hypothetical protein A2895_01205 [Candidatus